MFVALHHFDKCSYKIKSAQALALGLGGSEVAGVELAVGLVSECHRVQGLDSLDSILKAEGGDFLFEDAARSLNERTAGGDHGATGELEGRVDMEGCVHTKADLTAVSDCDQRVVHTIGHTQLGRRERERVTAHLRVVANLHGVAHDDTTVALRRKIKVAIQVV